MGARAGRSTPIALTASIHYWSVAFFCLLFWREPNILDEKEKLAALAPFLVYEFFSIFFEVFGCFAAAREGKAARIAATFAIGGAWLGFCHLFFSKGFHYDGLFWWALACTQAWASDIIGNQGKVVGLAATRAPCFLAAIFAGAICQAELPLWGLDAFSSEVLNALASNAIKQNLPVQALLFAMMTYCVWVASATVFAYLGPPKENPAADGAKGSTPPVKARDLFGVGLFLGPFALTMGLGLLGVGIPPILIAAVVGGPVLVTVMGVVSTAKVRWAPRPATS